MEIYRDFFGTLDGDGDITQLSIRNNGTYRQRVLDVLSES